MVLFGIWSILVAMKRIINERGGNLGDSMHEEIAAVYKGSNDEVDFFEINVEKFSNFRWFFSKPLAS